jgi:hypothetical protein
MKKVPILREQKLFESALSETDDSQSALSRNLVIIGYHISVKENQDG